MLVRDLISEKQKIDEVAIAIPLGQILTQMLIAGGITLAAYITSKALEQADIEFPNIDLDFKNDIESNIDIPTGVMLPPTAYDVSVEDIQAYLDGVKASELAAAAAIDRKMGMDNRPPRNIGRKLRRAGDIIEDIIEWIISLIGETAFKILVGLGLGLLSIYTIYKMGKWIISWFKSEEGQEEIEKAKKESLDEKQVWGRTGKRVVRKYRCSGGRRHGRIVSKMSQCFAPLDFKQSARFKRLKKAIGTKMARKAKRTKRVNPASKRLKQLNKRR